MRALRLFLLILTLILGQVGLARPNFVRPGGELCRTCLTLRDETPQVPPSFDGFEQRIGISHGDCHDCCTLVAQSSPTVDAHSTGLSAFDGFVAILPSAVTISLPVLRPTRTSVPLTLAAHPPNGPPSLCASRAPPASTIGL